MQSTRFTIAVSALGLQILTLCFAQAASANYYKHYRHEERKAAHQRMEANYDAATGRWGKARMHQRKAMKDDFKARTGW